MNRLCLTGLSDKVSQCHCKHDQVQFEERQAELETRLSKYERPGDKNIREGDHPHTHIGALEKELEAVKERYKRRLAEVENEAERLRKEVVSLKTKDDGEHQLTRTEDLLSSRNKQN